MYYFLYDNHNLKREAILTYNSNSYDRTKCDNCNAISAPWNEPIRFDIKGVLCDYYLFDNIIIISEKFLNLLSMEKYTGYLTRNCIPRRWNSKNCNDSIEKKYFELIVTGSCGLMCDNSGEPVPYCRKCHRKLCNTGLISNGVSFNPNSYDGSDIFAFDSLSNIPIVSEEVKYVLIKSKLTNLRFVPLSDFVYNEPMTKEKAIKRINKGVAYPELIEAWLKYGVLTEQELNEQLNKDRL